MRKLLTTNNGSDDRYQKGCKHRNNLAQQNRLYPVFSQEGLPLRLLLAVLREGITQPDRHRIQNNRLPTIESCFDGATERSPVEFIYHASVYRSK